MEPVLRGAGLLQSKNCAVVYWEDLLQRVPMEGESDQVYISSTSACYSIYTSGSTGKPKGIVPVTHITSSETLIQSTS